MTKAPRIAHAALFAGAWAFYGLLAYTLASQTHAQGSDCCFGLDQMRVLGSLAQQNMDPFHSNVHPLFVLFVRPVVMLLAWGFSAPAVHVILALQTALAALSVVLVRAYCLRVSNHNPLSWCLTGLYLFSCSQMLYSSLVESFIYAGCSLAAMHYVFLRAQKLGMPALAAWGVMAFSVTITNVAQFFILAFLHMRQNRQGWVYYARIIAVVMLAVTGLSLVQKQLYPQTEPYYTLASSIASEARFVSWSPVEREDAHLPQEYSGNYALTYATTVLTQGWLFVPLRSSPNRAGRIMFDNISSQVWFGNVMLLITIVSAAVAVRSAAGPALCLLFNLALHAIYGLFTGYIYTQHFLFLMPFLIAHGYAKLPQPWQRPLLLLLCLMLCYEAVHNLQGFANLYSVLLTHYRL